MPNKIFAFAVLTAATLSEIPVPVRAQTLTNNGASITISSSASLTVKGSVSNASGATITNDGTLNVSGNTVNNGTFSSATPSTLRLEGTTAQTVSGATPVTAGDVIINNAAGVTVSTPLNVAGAMTFTAGLVTATNSAAPVIFTATGTVANTPTDASHINGYVRKQGTGAFTFPVGDAARYQPVGTNLSANGSGMTARYFSADAGIAAFGSGGSSATPLQYYNALEYWDLTPVSTATGTVTISFDNYNNTYGGTLSDLRVAHKSGGQWLNEGGTPTGTLASGSVTSNSINTFSPFTLGSISTGIPLPVKLVFFRGTSEASANRLQWQTAAEDAGTAFTVERSRDGVRFERMQTLAGTGNSSSYDVVDGQPQSGITYYRLLIAEASGHSFYSSIVALRRAGGGSGEITIYPLPATEQVTIRNTDEALAGTAAAVVDAQGRIVASFNLQPVQSLDVRNWAAGVYTLRLADGAAVKIIKR